MTRTLGQHMSPAALQADTDASDRDYIAQRNAREVHRANACAWRYDGDPCVCAANRLTVAMIACTGQGARSYRRVRPRVSIWRALLAFLTRPSGKDRA